MIVLPKRPSRILRENAAFSQGSDAFGVPDDAMRLPSGGCKWHPLSMSGTKLAGDREFMEVAKEEARKGLAEGGIPIGAALVVDGQVIGSGHNRRVQLGSPIRHGETDALEQAGRQPASVYRKATMYTTLSPCDMCTGSILLYEIPRVVMGENRTFMGGEDYLRSRGVEVVNLDDAECVGMMNDFIAESPELWNEDIGE
jgi:cytosine/creatinine deaminase